MSREINNVDLSFLTERQRRLVCRFISGDNINEAAKNLSITTRSVYRRMEGIWKRLEKRGSHITKTAGEEERGRG